MKSGRCSIMTSTRKLTFASVCLACCFFLPLLTDHNPQAAAMLCLMHFPVMVCGMMCGAPWGVAVGMTAPILRSLMFGIPDMYPQAVAMCLEMGVYGLVCGLEANDSRKSPGNVFLDLILAMVAGRVAWGAAMTFFSIISPITFSIEAFKTTVLNTWPGSMLQLMALPPLIVFLQYTYYPDNIEAL